MMGDWIHHENRFEAVKRNPIVGLSFPSSGRLLVVTRATPKALFKSYTTGSRPAQRVIQASSYASQKLNVSQKTQCRGVAQICRHHRESLAQCFFRLIVVPRAWCAPQPKSTRQNANQAVLDTHLPHFGAHVHVSCQDSVWRRDEASADSSQSSLCSAVAIQTKARVRQI